MDHPPRPTLAELLARCDLARLHPDRLRRNLERGELADTAAAHTEGVQPVAGCKDSGSG